MALELNDILESKIYVKDNAAVSFKSPREYIEPFLESVQHLNPIFNVDISGAVSNKNAEDNKLNQAFARVKIEAKLPTDYDVEEHSSVIGMVYGLDTQKPVMKIYSGRNAWACTNLAIFRADHIHQVELVQGINTIYEKSRLFSNQVADHVQQFQIALRDLKETHYTGDEIDKVIGALIRKSIQSKAIGTTPILNATQALYDKASKYTIKDSTTSKWNIYSAITQYITDKVDIVDKCTKTIQVSNMFENLNFN